MTDMITEHALYSSIVKTVNICYLLALPRDYGAQPNRRWPLVLFLHGAGERGDDLNQVKANGLPREIAAGQAFPFITVAPQCPSGQIWDPDALLALLDEVESTYQVDPNRVYVTGLSMGGAGTWAVAAAAPQRFAALAVVCGRAVAAPAAATLAHLPIWLFHGAQDPVVPLENSEVMASRLRQAGGDVRFTVYPDTGHDSWTATYANPALYEWLLAQQRQPSSHPAPAG